VDIVQETWNCRLLLAGLQPCCWKRAVFESVPNIDQKASRSIVDDSSLSASIMSRCWRLLEAYCSPGLKKCRQAVDICSQQRPLKRPLPCKIGIQIRFEELTLLVLTCYRKHGSSVIWLWVETCHCQLLWSISVNKTWADKKNDKIQIWIHPLNHIEQYW